MEIILYFVMTTQTEGGPRGVQMSSRFIDTAEAEETAHSMRRGVFDSDDVSYFPVRMEYVIDQEEA